MLITRTLYANPKMPVLARFEQIMPEMSVYSTIKAKRIILLTNGFNSAS